MPEGGVGRWLNSTAVDGHIDECPAGEVVEVGMRLDVGVEPCARAVHRELADQAVTCEQVERVVDGGLGDAGAGGAQAGQYLFCREVLGAAEEQGRDAHALCRGADPQRTRRCSQPLASAAAGRVVTCIRRALYERARKIKRPYRKKHSCQGFP